MYRLYSHNLSKDRHHESANSPPRINAHIIVRGAAHHPSHAWSFLLRLLRGASGRRWYVKSWYCWRIQRRIML